jgi:hypothetical protein
MKITINKQLAKLLNRSLAELRAGRQYDEAKLPGASKRRANARDSAAAKIRSQNTVHDLAGDFDGGQNKMEPPRIDPFLYNYFLVYARDLREEFSGQTIRNAAVVESAVQEFARRGLITLVKAHDAIPDWLPPGKVKLAKAKNSWLLDAHKTTAQKLDRDFVRTATSFSQWFITMVDHSEKRRAWETSYVPAELSHTI